MEPIQLVFHPKTKGPTPSAVPLGVLRFQEKEVIVEWQDSDRDPSTSHHFCRCEASFTKSTIVHIMQRTPMVRISKIDSMTETSRGDLKDLKVTVSRVPKDEAAATIDFMATYTSNLEPKEQNVQKSPTEHEVHEYVLELEKKQEVPWAESKTSSIYLRLRWVHVSEAGFVTADRTECYIIPRSTYLPDLYWTYMVPDTNSRKQQEKSQSDWTWFLKTIGHLSDPTKCTGSRHGDRTDQPPQPGQTVIDCVRAVGGHRLAEIKHPEVLCYKCGQMRYQTTCAKVDCPNLRCAACARQFGISPWCRAGHGCSEEWNYHESNCKHVQQSAVNQASANQTAPLAASTTLADIRPIVVGHRPRKPARSVRPAHRLVKSRRQHATSTPPKRSKR